MQLTEDVKRKLQDELSQVEKVIGGLVDYRECNMSEVPEELKKNALKIGMIPQLTSTGLESVNSVLDSLYITRFILKKRIAGEPLPDEEPFFDNPVKKDIEPVEVPESNGIKAIVEPQVNPTLQVNAVISQPNVVGPRPRARQPQPSTPVAPQTSSPAPRPRVKVVAEKPLINYQKYSQISDQPDNSPKKDDLDPFER